MPSNYENYKPKNPMTREDVKYILAGLSQLEQDDMERFAMKARRHMKDRGLPFGPAMGRELVASLLRLAIQRGVEF